MTSPERYVLASGRAETRLPDKKPLYTQAEAVAEAERCLYCADAPCIQACPTEINIPTFIQKIASGNVRGSAQTIFEQNILGHSCARVCPVEVLCVGSCVYTGWGRDPIQIGRLQRYATTTATEKLGPEQFFAPNAPTGKKVALIGAGPASLACAAALAIDGHKATIFEKRPLPGGLNTTGIAPYKLHAADSLAEVEWITRLGVEIRTGEEVGRTVKAETLLTDFDAVYIGVGLGADSVLGIPGESGNGVIGATAWIESMKLEPDSAKLGRVLVIGGGNTAIDVARECALLGATEVSMVYRRGEKEMSGYVHEMNAGRKEGVRLVLGAQPVAFVHAADGSLRGLRVNQGGAEVELPCDVVIVAIGQSKLRELAAMFPGVTLDAKGCIQADPKTGATGNPKVLAGGDAINGGKEVVNAVADGRNTARHLNASWTKK